MLGVKLPDELAPDGTGNREPSNGIDVTVF